MSSKATRLSGPAQLAAAAATVYTVPAGAVTIVRSLHIQNPSGVAVNFTLSLGLDAAGKRLYDAYSIPAAGAGVTGNAIELPVYWVLNAAEVIQAFASAAGVLVLTLNGQELTAG